MAVVQTSALAMLKRLYKKGYKDCLLIVDDTQTIKRAKKMQAVGKIHHHATGKYCMGHTVLKARMHQIIWHQEVQNVIKVSHEKTVIRR